MPSDETTAPTDMDNPAPPAAEAEEEVMGERIDRLSGEPAPDISPEEFARLQQGGPLNLDSRGRIRANRRSDDNPGVTLRRRRAWYA